MVFKQKRMSVGTELHQSVNRVFSQVVLTNVPEQQSSTVTAASKPGRPENEPYEVPFSRVVYIEATDFRLQDSKDYYGLAPGKSAMLR